MDKFDTPFTTNNTFDTNSSVKPETNSTDPSLSTSSTNPQSFNVSTNPTDLAEEVSSKLLLDSDKQTTDNDDVINIPSATSADDDSSGHQHLDCTPPDIQITPVATVDQNASDYEPEELDPHPTPAGVITPEEEGTSTPTESPADHPTDDPVEPVLTQHSTETDAGVASLESFPAADVESSVQHQEAGMITEMFH